MVIVESTQPRESRAVLSLKRIGGNTSLGDAQIILFADNHIDKVQRQNTLRAAGSLSQKGDSLLLEGLPYEAVNPNIKPGLMVRGWDDALAWDLTKYLLRRMHWLSFFAERIPEASDEVTQAVYAGRRRRLANEESRAFQEVWGPLFRQRTETLLANVENNQEEGNGKTFVIAGKLHLVGEKGIETALEEKGYRFVVCEAPGETISAEEETKRVAEHMRRLSVANQFA